MVALEVLIPKGDFTLRVQVGGEMEYLEKTLDNKPCKPHSVPRLDLNPGSLYSVVTSKCFNYYTAKCPYKIIFLYIYKRTVYIYTKIKKRQNKQKHLMYINTDVAETEEQQ